MGHFHLHTVFDGLANFVYDLETYFGFYWKFLEFGATA